MKKRFAFFPLLVTVPLLIALPVCAQVTLGTSASSTNPERSGDATTGLFSSTADAVSISSGGTEKMRVNATGLGVGTSNPQTVLTINANTSGVPGISVSSVNAQIVGANSSINSLEMDAFADNDTILLVRSDGSVSSPSAVLSGEAMGSINGGGYNGSAVSTNKAGIIFGAGGNWSTSSEPAYITFSTTPVGSTTKLERVRIDTTGDMGIGTTTPVNLLDVYGAEAIGTSYAGVDTAPTNGLIVQGDVGIGTSSPTNGVALDVGSNTNSILLPSGTTAQRPTGVAGMERYNSSNSIPEFYTSSWLPVPLTASPPISINSTTGNITCSTCNTSAANVISVSGDGTFYTNSASTGAVTLTLGNAPATSVWGNNTSSGAAPSYQTSLVLSGTVTASNIRTRLTANQTFYISTTGSDSHNCLTSGAACATLNHVWNLIATNYDLAGYTATIQLADGTYTSGLDAELPITTGPVVINGDSTTPSNVVISTTGSDCIDALGVVFTIQNLELTASGTDFGALGSFDGAVVTMGPGLIFGAVDPTSGGQIVAQTGGTILIGYPYAIIGGGAFHYYAADGSLIRFNGSSAITVTVSGTPSFGQEFASSIEAAKVVLIDVTYSGSATGTRYLSYLNGVIDTDTGNTSLFPGNAAGTTTLGGQYN